MEIIGQEIQKENRSRAFSMSLIALRNVLEQLGNKKAYMCAVGRTNMGKSKTLNVLMDNE